MYPPGVNGNSVANSSRRPHVPDTLTVDAVLAVARHGGMNQAAKYLGVSQQAVSTRIAKLEKHLGTRIFWRGAAGSSLTDTGTAVVNALEGLQRAQAECVRQLEEALGGDISDELTIAVSHTVAEMDYPRWAAEFQRDHPHTRLHMLQLNSRDAQREVVDGHAELAIVEGNWVAHELHQRVLGHDELVVAVPAQHPWAAAAQRLDSGLNAEPPADDAVSITKQELIATPLVLREQGSGTREVVEDVLGTLTTPAGEFGSLGAQRTAIGALGAPGVIARRAIAGQLATGEYVEVPVPGVNFDRPLRAVWSAKNHPSEAARNFLRFLVASS